MSRIDREWPRRDPESGNVLVISLLVLFLLTSLGVSYVAVTKADKQVAGNQLAGSQAFSNSEAGISEVLVRMSNPNSGHYIGQAAGAWTAGWGRYVVNDPGSSANDPQYDVTVTDGLDNDLDAATDETSEHYPETGSRQFLIPLASRLDYPWVKVRYKLNGANQILRFGDHDNNPTTPPRENTAVGVPEIVITSSGRRGIGKKLVTVEAVKWPLPPVPGSVYTEGQMDFNGSAFNVSGHDHDADAPWDTIPGAPALPGIATTHDPNLIEVELNGPQSNNVQGAGSEPSVEPAIVDLDLLAMAAAWSQVADISLVGNQNNPNTSTWGTMSHVKIVRISGDLHVSGTASGCGVLIVEGNMVLSGTFNWNGIVLCLGDITVTGGGIDKQIVGALLVQGSAVGSTALNGNIKLLYSSEMISKLNNLSRYEISSWIDQ